MRVSRSFLFVVSVTKRPLLCVSVDRRIRGQWTLDFIPLSPGTNPGGVTLTPLWF